MDDKGEGASNDQVRPWSCANAQFRVIPPEKQTKYRRKKLTMMKEVAESGINATPYVEIEWDNGKRQKALFDTGAQWSLIAEEQLIAEEVRMMEEPSLSGQGVTGSKIPVVGEIWRTVMIGKTVFENQRFIVVKQMICPIILGIDLWSRVSHLSFDFEKNEVRINDSPEGIKLWTHPSDHQIASAREKEEDERKVVIERPVVIPARSEVYVDCICREMEEGQDYMIQPISQAESLVSTPFGVVRGVTGGKFQVKMANLDNVEVQLEDNQCIATLEKDVWINRVSSGNVFKNTSSRKKSTINLEDMCDNLLDGQKKKQLLDVLQKHQRIFHTGGKLPIVQVGVEHTINLKNNVAPTVCRPRRLSQDLAAEVKEHIEKLLKEGVIRESNSEWASPIVCARRADGSLRLVIDYRLTNEKSRTATLHPIPLIDDLIDHLSKAKYFSILDAKSGYHQMPLRKEDSAATAFVVPWGHYEFADRCPFGLKGAGYSFQRMMSAILGNSNFVEALCYLDDILVWGESWEIHIQRLEQILIKIEKAGLALSPSKCRFGSTHVDYLGCRIGEGMLHISEQRVEQLRNIEQPKNVRSLRGALGAFAYVQRWIPGLAELAKPLYEATTGKAYARLKWTDEMTQSFEEIKKMIADAIALRIPDVDEEFVLVTDCSNIAAGAMLAQMEENGERLLPCAFFHHTLSASEKNYSATEKELLAIVLAVKKFRVYLSKKFRLITDHQALKWLKSLNPENETGRRGRWLDLLQQFDMEIVPKKGRSPEMRIADFLSRVNMKGSCQDELTRTHGLVLTTTDQHDRSGEELLDLSELRRLQNEDAAIYTAKQAVNNGADLNPGGSDSADWRRPSSSNDKTLLLIWRMKDRLVIDDDGLLKVRFNGGRKTRKDPFGSRQQLRTIVPRSYKDKVLCLLHSSSTAAHMGIQRTWKRARNNFWWPEMKEDITKFIQQCVQCGVNKHVNTPNQAPMSKTNTPNNPLEEIMVDFVGPFQQARSHNFRYALQIQDVFSRFLIFVPTIDNTAPTAAEAIRTRWLAIFGMPKKIRSDRGSHFTAEIFEDLWKSAGIKHKLGSPEHPQSQGQVERQNQLINQVRCLCENDVERWPSVIYSVQCSHNGAINSSTGYSPARIVLGDKFKNPEDILLGQETSEFSGSVQDMIHRREEEDETVYRAVKQSISKQQDDKIQKLQSRGKAYQVGDMVRYKLNDDVRNRQGGKIAPRYSKEYEVIEVLGDGFTYKLQAVNHNGRVKDRHFNLLKTVERMAESEGDTDESGADETILMSGDQEGELNTSSPVHRDKEFPHVPATPTQLNAPTSEDTAAWVRRSRRKCQKTKLLQADGTKKSYTSSSTTLSDNDSE